MAILAMFLLRKKENQSLEHYLENEVFEKVESQRFEGLFEEKPQGKKSLYFRFKGKGRFDFITFELG